MFQDMVPRKDLFTAFSVAKSLQRDISLKCNQISFLNNQLDVCKMHLADVESGIQILLNVLNVVFAEAELMSNKSLMKDEMLDLCISQCKNESLSAENEPKVC